MLGGRSRRIIPEPNSHPLEGVRLKLSRAEHHHEVLRDLITRFLDSKPYGVVEKRDSETGRDVLRARIRKQIDPRWSLVLGDALHNYRATLDQLVYVLSSTQGREAPARCEFPIYAEKTGDSGFFRYKRNGELVPGCGAWKIRGVRKRPQQIIRGLQPYQRGKEARAEALWLLQELNIRDKHRLLNVAGSQMLGAVVYREGYEIVPVYGSFEADSILAYVARTRGRKPKPNVDFEPFFDVVLNQDGPGDGLGLRYLLVEIRDAIRAAVHRLEPYTWG